MSQGEGFFVYKHLTASAVVSAQPLAKLHTVNLNNIAATATVGIYDAIATNDTSTPIALFIAPAGGIIGGSLRFDIIVTNGIMVVIGVAAADVTVTYR